MTILVMVDMLTKMAHFIACAGVPTAREMAQLFVHHIFQLHSLPKHIMSDQGAQFTAQFWHAPLGLLQMQVCLSSAHHPEMDGGTKLMNPALKQYL